VEPVSLAHLCPSEIPEPSSQGAIQGNENAMVPGSPSLLIVCRYGKGASREPSEALAGPTATASLAGDLNHLPSVAGDQVKYLTPPSFALLFHFQQSVWQGASYQAGPVQQVLVSEACGLVTNGQRFAQSTQRLVNSLREMVAAAGG
jgi:hypothetical protein